jgi:hypothetical protein
MAEQELKVYVPESGVATIRRIPLPEKNEDREAPALQFKDIPIRHIPDYMKVSPEARKFAARVLSRIIVTQLLIDEQGFSPEAADYIISTRPNDEDMRDTYAMASSFNESFYEFETEAELLAAVEHDDELFNSETGEYTPPTLEYVFQHYKYAKELPNGHFIIYDT